MNQYDLTLLKLVETRQLLLSNDVIPFSEQMEILISLDDKDADKRIREHYTQFLKDGVINQEKFNSLMQAYGTHQTNPAKVGGGEKNQVPLLRSAGHDYAGGEKVLGGVSDLRGQRPLEKLQPTPDLKVDPVWQALGGEPEKHPELLTNLQQ